MSTIVRLQNLPLIANALDIRNFFGGLYILDGGVYITGGISGDAFITFTSDADARVAMRKNGYKLMDVPVKLYLSSHSEMQQEIERITKQNPNQVTPDLRSTIDDYGGSFYRSYSPSPSLRRRGYSRYCRSPSPRMSSRSPRMRSRSPEMSSASQRSRSRSLGRGTGMLSVQNSRTPPFVDENSLGSEGSSNVKIKSEYDWEIKAQFGQNCSATLNAGTNDFGTIDYLHQKQRQINANVQVKRSFSQLSGLEQNSLPNKKACINSSNLSTMLTYNMSAPKGFATEVPSLRHTNFLTLPTNTSPVVDLPSPMCIATPSLPSMENSLPCSPFAPVPTLPSITMHEKPNENLFVTLTGLDPEWGLRKIQNILSGIFIPDRNIKFDLDNSGSKTGTVYIKLSNTNDFKHLLSHKKYFYKYKLITVSVCPDHVFNKHFTPETPKPSLNSEIGMYYCKMEGLPVDVTSQDVLEFFEDLEVIDLYIAFAKNCNGQRIVDKAKGTAFVAFGNKSDYQKALLKNGHRFKGANRNFQIRSIKYKEVVKRKKINNDHIFQSKSFVAVQGSEPVPCTFGTILTGLPETVTSKKIFAFFVRSGAKPGKIHISLNDKQLCDGRAFVEFRTLHLLKKACKVDGKRMSNLVISVKEISNEEMLKVLDSQKIQKNQTEPPHFHQTLDTCPDKTDKNPALRFNQEENFRKTTVTAKNIKVENVSDGAEVQRQGIPLKFLAEQPVEDQSKTFTSYRRDRNAKDALCLEARSSEGNFRKDCNTYPSESYVFQNEMRDLKEFCSKTVGQNYAEDINYVGRDNGTDDGQWSVLNMCIGENLPVRETSYANTEPYAYDGMHAHYEKAVVQIRNIDPVLEITDLMNFLWGYDIDENNIIRIFNHHGYPTAEVRVTFRNHMDAERAIKSLNGRLVNGVPVEMFAVQDPTTMHYGPENNSSSFREESISLNRQAAGRGVQVSSPYSKNVYY